MKTEELIRHIEHYMKTGTIVDELVPCYDQHGRWQGDTIQLIISAKLSLIQKIRRSQLPRCRRTKSGRFGTILLTSYVWGGKNPVTIPYREIKGDVLIIDNASVHAAGLRHVGGKFLANHSTRLYLPQLTSVRGSFEAVNGFRIKAPRLSHVGGDLSLVCYVPPRIESVGGRFGAYWVSDFQTPRLKHIGGALVAPKAEVLEAPVLETIRGGLLLGNLARRLRAPLLQSVGGDLLAETVTDLCVPRLRAVGGDLCTQAAKGYYRPDVRVAGEWASCPGAREEWVRREAARQAIRGTMGPIYL